MRAAVAAPVAAALTIAAGLGACAPSPGEVTLDGPGGEAWTFEKVVTGEVTGDCDEVVVAGPRGEARATVDEGGFAAVVPLVAGDNQVAAICRRGDVERRSSPQRWTVRLPDAPRAAARARWADDGLLLDGTGSRPGPVRPAAITRWTWTARADNPAPVPGLPASGATAPILAPAVDGDYVIDLVVADADGVEDRAAVRIRVDDGVARPVDATREHPAWGDEAVIYGMAPYFYGDGTLDDVIPRLDALAALGVTAIWVSPVTLAAPGDYGYAVTDHFIVRDDLGGEAALRELVDAAHARGLKVIVDVVLNHTSIEHPYVEANPAFYERDAAGELDHYFDWEHLPNLEHDHPEVTAWLGAALRHLAVDLGVDGFRADVAWGPAERNPGFWPAVRAEVARVEPDLLWIAEGSARDAGLFHGGFDVAYDWTWEPGEWAWRAALEAADAAKLAAALTADGDGYDEDAVVLRFLDNNDTGARFATRHGVRRVPPAATVLFTVPGVPALWTGSETGAALEPYAEGPPVDDEDRAGLMPVYTRLAALRRELPALRGDAIELVATDPAASVLAYVRPAAEGGAPVLVVVDLEGEGGEVSLARTSAVTALLGGATSLRDAYHDELVPVRAADDRLRLALPADGVRVLVAP